MARRSLWGFTLIELLITIFVAGILAAVALPNMQMFVKNNRIKTAVGELAGALNLARSEAAKRGQRITVCARSTNSSCLTSGSEWKTGWLVFVDINANGQVDVGEEVLRITEPLATSLTATSAGFTSTWFVQYLPAGDMTTSGTYKFCDDRTGSFGRIIDLNLTGRVSVNPDKQTCP